MRKLVLSLAPATLAVVVLIACEDSSNLGGGSLTLDSGINSFDATSGFDATVPPQDSSVDAPVTPSVSVTITSGAGPKAGVQVVFHTAAGAVIETKPTGADGKATHVGSDAAMASALLANGSNRQIVTWTGVEVGDDLLFRDDRDSQSDQSIGLYNVTLPGTFADSGASVTFVDSPCGRNQPYGTASELSLRRGCSGAVNSILATAVLNDYFTPTGYAFKKGNTGISDGGTASIVLGDWSGPGSLDLTVANVPGEDSVQTSLLEIADGHGFYNNTGGYASSGTSFKTAAGFADAYQATIHYGYDSEQTITKHFAPAPSVAFDYAAFLPALSDSTLDTTAPRRPIVGWTGATTSADGGVVQFSFGGPEDANYTWTFVVPPGANTVTAPAMPTEVASFLPYDTDAGQESWFSTPEVLFVEADVIPSYAFFRQKQGTILGLVDSFGGYTLPALPTDGIYKTTSFTQRAQEGRAKQAPKL